MKKINVLFINSWYPNKIKKHNGKFIREHAKSVSEFCTITCLQVQGVSEQKDKFIIDKTMCNNVLEITIYYKKPNTFNLLKKKKRQHQAFKLGFEQLKNKVDIVHLNVIFPAGFFALYLKKKYGIPFIITEHNTAFLKEGITNFSFIQKKIIKNISKKASALCPVSTQLQNAMQDFGIKGNYYVIPNVIDTNIFTFKPKSISNKIRFLHVSTLNNAHKNYKGILRAFKNIVDKNANFILTIMSSTNMKEAKKYALKIGLPNNNIQFIPNKTSLDVAKAMQNNDVFVLFSNFETFSLVVAESLCCGTPVIATKVGIIPKIINKNNGLLVTVGNEKMFFNKLLKMFKNYKKYKHKNISDTAVTTYNYKTVGLKYFELYKKIIAKN